MVDGMIPEEIVDGMLPEAIGEPVEPVEPAEPAEPAGRGIIPNSTVRAGPCACLISIGLGMVYMPAQTSHFYFSPVSHTTVCCFHIALHNINNQCYIVSGRCQVKYSTSHLQ